MRQRAVILAGIPDFFEGIRQRDHGGDLVGGITLVHVMQGLVVDKLIDGCRVQQIFMDLLAPVRPVVALEHHVGLAAEALICLDDILCPIVGIAHLCAAQGVQIMQRTGAVFRHPEGAVFREIGVHLGRGFGAGGQLEFDLQPVDGQLRNIFPNLIGRCDKAHMTGRLSHADADGECSFLPFFQHRTILILRTPGHCDAGIDVFADGVFQKSFRCKDDRFARGKLFVDGKAGVRYIVPVDRTLCAAKVIHMAMTVQHSFDIQRSEPVFHQRFCCLHIFFAHQDIKNDPAVVGADEGRIGHIKAAHLIDAITYFKQTGFGVELGIPPQTGVYSVRSIPVQIAVALQIPCKFAILGVDDLIFRIVQPAAFCVGKLPPV